MKRKLQLLGMILPMVICSVNTLTAQTALPGILEAENGILAGTAVVSDGNGGTANVVKNLKGPSGENNSITFNVSVATAGIYNFQTNYLTNSTNTSGIIAIIPDLGGVPFNVFGGVFLPITGAGVYGIAAKNYFFLPAGTYDLKFYNPTSNALTVDNFTITAGSPRTKHPMNVLNIADNSANPALASNIVEAENYDEGGQGITFYDTSAGNFLSSQAQILSPAVNYRSDNVDVGLASTASNGNVIGNLGGGEWQEFTADVMTSGSYTLELTYSSGKSGGGTDFGQIILSTVDNAGVEITKLIDDANAIKMSNTGNYQTYTTAAESVPFNLTAGTNQILRFGNKSNGVNLDKYRFVYKGAALSTDNFQIAGRKLIIYPSVSATGIFNLSEETKWEVFSITGQKINQGEGTIVNIASSSKGVYIVKTPTSSTKIIVQ